MSDHVQGTPLSGRRAQAARNDAAILEAARVVFVAEPDAPIAAVARAAGVGISALYHRYPSKEMLLSTLCLQGLQRFVDIARASRDVEGPGEAFETFLRRIVDADVHSLTVHLAGRFAPTPEHGELAGEASRLAGEILHRAQEANAVRADLSATDLPMLYEQLAAIRLGDAQRMIDLRRRYVEILLGGLRTRAGVDTALPGEAPTSDELGARWAPRT